MDGTITPANVRVRLKSFLSTTPLSTQEVICHHAHLNVDELCVMPNHAAVSKSVVDSDSDLIMLDKKDGSVISWPMSADKKLAALPITDNESDTESASSFVGHDVLCFIFDTLTSAHLTVITGKTKHVSVSLDVEFAQALRVEEPFTLTTSLLRVGQNIVFLTGMIHQKQGEDVIMCARADHTKAFYTQKPPHYDRLPMSKL